MPQNLIPDSLLKSLTPFNKTTFIMKRLFALTILFVICLNVFLQQQVIAQDKKLDVYSIASSPGLYPQRMRTISWIPGTNDIAFSRDMITLQKMSFPSKKTETIIGVEAFHTLVKALLEETDEKAPDIRRLPAPEWIDQNSFLFMHANMYFRFHVPDKKVAKLNSWPEDAEATDFCRENNLMAYTKGNNLFISVGGKEIAVTNETDPGIKMCNYVHREEFGIKKGTFWSPKGTFLAFYRMDERDVTEYPIVDVTKRIATLNPEKYPMAGMTSHYVTLGVFNVSNGKTVYMKTGEPKDQYLTSVTWSPDEKHVFIGLLNREQNHLKLNMYNAATGDLVSTLFEEQSDKYVEPLDPMFFLPCSADKFLWMSQRDGYRHLYLYDNRKTAETDNIGKMDCLRYNWF
jgi:dipeptidyl-peptidase 4